MVPSRQALLRSQSGPGAGAAFSVTPSSALTRIEFLRFRMLLQRRLHLPLPLSNRICGCGRPIDSFGHHRAVCGRTGVLGEGGVPIRKHGSAHVQGSWRPCARTCWSATWFWHCHKQWWTSGGGCRRIATLGRRPICSRHQNGVDCEVTETPDEELRHETEWRCHRQEGTRSGFTPNWLALELGRLVVLALEVGGRWSPEATNLVSQLTKVKVWSEPFLVCRRMEQAWRLRWAGLLARPRMEVGAHTVLHQGHMMSVTAALLV